MLGVYIRMLRHDGDKLNWDAVVRLPDFELPMVKAARKAFIAEHSNFFEPGSRVLWRKTLAKLAPQTSGQVPPGYGPSGLDDRGHADGRNASSQRIGSTTEPGAIALSSSQSGLKSLTCRLLYPNATSSYTIPIRYYLQQKFPELSTRQRLTPRQ